MPTTYRKKNRTILSIIIATLNVGKTIEECLDSIIQQTEINEIEILVKDGGSTDETIKILKAYKEHISYWETSSDPGIYHAWNALLPKATGEWILFLGADDKLFNNSVISEFISKYRSSEKNIDLIYGKVRLIGSNDVQILDLGKDWGKTKKCLREKMCIPHQGLFHKSSLFDKYGNFNTDYMISSDYDFVKRVISNDNILFLDIIVSYMRTGGLSSNRNYTFTRINELRRINSAHGEKIPGVLWVITYANAWFRTLIFKLLGERRGKITLDYLRKIGGQPPLWTKL